MISSVCINVCIYIYFPTTGCCFMSPFLSLGGDYAQKCILKRVHAIPSLATRAKAQQQSLITTDMAKRKHIRHHMNESASPTPHSHHKGTPKVRNSQHIHIQEKSQVVM